MVRAPPHPADPLLTCHTGTRLAETNSRNMLAVPHCNPSDPAAYDLLQAVYQTLLGATLVTYPPKYPLAPQAIVTFIKSVLEHLPSPSSTKSSNAVVFGEILVEAIWGADLVVDDINHDVDTILSPIKSGKPPLIPEGEDPTAFLDKTIEAKKICQTDRKTFGGIVRELVVSATVLCYFVHPYECSLHIRRLAASLSQTFAGNGWTRR